MSIRSKTDRAIVAYLEGCGLGAVVYPANSPEDRAFPSITVKAHSGHPDPQFSGCYRFEVVVEIQAVAGNTTQDDPEAARVALDATVESVNILLMQSDNDGQNLIGTAKLINTAAAAKSIDDPLHHADLADFTMQWWEERGPDAGRVNEPGSAWVELLTFSCVSAGKAGLLG